MSSLHLSLQNLTPKHHEVDTRKLKSVVPNIEETRHKLETRCTHRDRQRYPDFLYAYQCILLVSEVVFRGRETKYGHQLKYGHRSCERIRSRRLGTVGTFQYYGVMLAKGLQGTVAGRVGIMDLFTSSKVSSFLSET